MTSHSANEVRSGPNRGTLLVAAAAVSGLLVVPVAVAGPSGSSDAEATASGSVKKQLKKLKKQVKQLEQQLAEIELQPGPQGPPGPSTGQAGGDLTGNYPNPAIGPGAVNSGKVAANSLTGADLNEGTLNLGLEIGAALSAANSNSPKSVTANCPAGKRAVGLSAAQVLGGKTGTSPNQTTQVALTAFGLTGPTSGRAEATETTATGANWSVLAVVNCAGIAG